ncbi:hypothetical protein [Tannerella forsythia]|uniref:Uncharacterized protein n=1 Tax=Tannerella forsythia TaxID=28112 RepID=A0A3P1XK58_TANFO|nr:hypothetical protein [Tannerella forsythia]RRD59154.1 hypothetical protein EII40_11085 [Tannerella forsythia]
MVNFNREFWVVEGGIVFILPQSDGKHPKRWRGTPKKITRRFPKPSRWLTFSLVLGVKTAKDKENIPAFTLVF